ncbi:13238_t:CDS:2, partial [Ambispora leptoticha]
LKCDDEEAKEEPPAIIHETFIELDCHITIMINYLQDGIKEDFFKKKLDRESPSLKRQASYTKTVKISRLPKYLTIQFVRFFWKTQERVRTKIVRKVRFPLTLDMTEFCTEELQSKILPVKNKLVELEKEQESAKKKAKLAKNPEQAKEKSTIDPAVAEEIEKLIDPELAKDIGANVTGLYDLCAVLTHKGRSADSGHYVAWVQEWIKYDDDHVSIVHQDEILKLDGGLGDWHTAYMLLYRSKEIPK